MVPCPSDATTWCRRHWICFRRGWMSTVYSDEFIKFKWVFAGCLQGFPKDPFVWLVPTAHILLLTPQLIFRLSTVWHKYKWLNGKVVVVVARRPPAPTTTKNRKSFPCSRSALLNRTNKCQDRWAHASRQTHTAIQSHTGTANRIRDCKQYDVRDAGNAPPPPISRRCVRGAWQVVDVCLIGAASPVFRQSETAPTFAAITTSKCTLWCGPRIVLVQLLLVRAARPPSPYSVMDELVSRR